MICVSFSLLFFFKKSTLLIPIFAHCSFSISSKTLLSMMLNIRYVFIYLVPPGIFPEIFKHTAKAGSLIMCLLLLKNYCGHDRLAHMDSFIAYYIT